MTYQLFRQNGRLLERITALERGVPAPEAMTGVPQGAPAPGFDLPELGGGERSLADLLDRRVPVALAFLDPNCGACGPAVTELAAIRKSRGDELAVAILTRGHAEAARQKVNGYEFDAVLLEAEREVADAFGVTRVPSVQLVDPAGRIASPLAVGGEAITQLLGGGPRTGLPAVQVGA